jgi:lipopolysaccharide/colanic/teichoic acid biosynthesis glycosyltransferase
MDGTTKTLAWRSRDWTVISLPDESIWVDKRLGTAWLSRLFAVVLLIGALPVIALAICLVRLSSPGAAIYRQVRLGAGGKRFVLYKIRTMVAQAEASCGPVWTQPNDPRVTRAGRLLRALGWDELPQLVNVVKGEMAFVGPRPERPEIAAALARGIPGYYARLAVRPGITGLAQINLSADASVDDVRKKLQLDLEYVNEASRMLDVKIVLATAPRLFAVRASWVARLLGVWRAVPAEPQILALRVKNVAGTAKLAQWLEPATLAAARPIGAHGRTWRRAA